MDLKIASQQIKNALEQRRKEIELTFIEEKHIYFMKDVNGVKRKTFPSVSKIINKFYKPFDANGISFKMAKGNLDEQKRILSEWKASGDYSTNMGSRVHYLLESLLVQEYDNYKNVREPIFSCDESQIKKGDIMVSAGKDFIDLMHKRGAVLLDTEVVLGDPELGYVGQPDKIWLMMNKAQTDFGLVVTDWKSNQPKNFEVQPYTDKMYSPFQDYPNIALTHYFLQIPLYGKLLLKMLKGTEFENKKFMGGVVVLLKEDGTFQEYKVPKEITDQILSMNLSSYIK